MIKSFIAKHKVNHFTVIDDAAMISTINVEELRKNNINFIVVASLGSLPVDLIDKIDNDISRKMEKH